ncbi:DUF6301 family protein [Nocardia sp. NBC_01327]|uniref:DUF6301 family protein n=1 Tax=Nocardia sp. NBC_01327 TaxID=2903593 RepID=UPI002E162715|nr:DUF6301 family protein [Nocardia sp. NBC_01327]
MAAHGVLVTDSIYLSVQRANVATVMRIPVRVDVMGAVEIARAAESFDWEWSLTDRERFAGSVGWSELATIEGADKQASFVRTALTVWGGSAVFWHSDAELRQVHVIVSDCPNSFEHETPELLAAAAEKVTAALAQVFGEPTVGAIGTDHGSVWELEGVAIGIVTSRHSVELMLVNPVWQRFWDGCQQERVTRRSGLTDWDRFAETLAQYLEDIPSDTNLIISASGNRYAQFAKTSGTLYAQLSHSCFVGPEWEYGEDVDRVLIAAGWIPPDGEDNWSRDCTEPIRTPDYSHLASRVVAGLQAIGVGSPNELQSEGWRRGGGALDTTALRPADDRPRAVYASNDHELPRNPSRSYQDDDVELDVPGGLDVIRAASNFDWTWTRTDVERFAAHAGWRDVSDLKLDRMIYATTGLKLEGSPQAIFWLAGDTLESVEVTISSDLCDYDLHSDSYSHLNGELDRALQTALGGFRDTLGESVHGTLRHSKSLCWEFPVAVVGAIRDHNRIVVELVSPAQRERSRTIALRLAADDIARASWNQLIEDLAAMLATGIPTKSSLVLGGEDNWFARFTSQPGALDVELGSPDFADPEWRMGDGTERHMIEYQGWTPPNDTRLNWHQQLSSPVMFRDYQHLAHCAVWALRARTTSSLSELKLRVQGSDTIDTAVWTWS